MTLVLFCLSLVPFPSGIVKAETNNTQKVKIRFNKADGDYTNWDIWTWWEGQDGKNMSKEYMQL